MRTKSRLLLLACVCISCIACHHAEATADPTPPPEPIGHVLIYTDNSPGSIVTAFAMNHVQRARRYATHIATTEADFIARLPEQAWTSVVVTTKFTSTTPGYRNALEQYVNNGGTAVIYTWKDDVENPTQADLVAAPCAFHIWADGKTSRGYSLCQSPPQRESPVLGYEMNDFQGLTISIHTLEATGCTTLHAGEYPPLADSSPPSVLGEDEKALLEELFRIQAQLEEDLAGCEEAYGPNPDADPPDPGDPDELEICKAEYQEAANKARVAAVRRYLVAKKKAERTP